MQTSVHLFHPTEDVSNHVFSSFTINIQDASKYIKFAK